MREIRVIEHGDRPLDPVGDFIDSHFRGRAIVGDRGVMERSEEVYDDLLRFMAQPAVQTEATIERRYSSLFGSYGLRSAPVEYRTAVANSGHLSIVACCSNVSEGKRVTEDEITVFGERAVVTHFGLAVKLGRSRWVDLFRLWQTGIQYRYGSRWINGDDTELDSFYSYFKQIKAVQ